MKYTEIENLGKQELLEKEKILKEELYKLNCQRYAGRVDKPHRFTLIKKDIARIKTALAKLQAKASEPLEGKRNTDNG